MKCFSANGWGNLFTLGPGDLMKITKLPKRTLRERQRVQEYIRSPQVMSMVDCRLVCYFLLTLMSMICIGKARAESDVAMTARRHVDQIPRLIYPLKRRLLPGIAGTKHQLAELPTTDAERLVWCNNLRQQYSMTPDKNTLGRCRIVLIYMYTCTSIYVYFYICT